MVLIAIEILTGFFLLIGSLFILLSSIGVVRLPDGLSRSHALAKGMTLGISLMLIGLWIHLYEYGVGSKILLAIFFQLVTIPVASHLFGLIARKKLMELEAAGQLQVRDMTEESDSSALNDCN